MVQTIEPPAVNLLSGTEWVTLRDQADVLVGSGAVPEDITDTGKALAVILRGRELGLPTVYSLSNIHLIGRDLRLGAQATLALIFAHHGDDAVRFTRMTDAQCEARYKRRGWTDYDTYSYTKADAEQAGLLDDPNERPLWHKNPREMLRWACVRGIGAIAFSDVVAGVAAPVPSPVVWRASDMNQLDLRLRYDAIAVQARSLGIAVEYLPLDASAERIAVLGEELRQAIEAKTGEAPSLLDP